jgi:phosphate transport system substrate-binding protein
VRALATYLVATVLTAPAAAPAPATIRYGGGVTVVETILQRGVGQAFKDRTGIAIQVVDRSGTGRGLDALLAGKVEVAGAGRPLTAAERNAGLVETVIGHDCLVMYVHRTNPVKDLDHAQLRDVLSGKVTSWKQLGGRDVKIVPFMQPVASRRAVVHLVQERVLGGGPFGPGVREVELIPDQLAAVAKTEGGICLASVGYLAAVEPEVRDGVRALSLDDQPPTDANIRSGTYLLARPLLLVTRGPPAGEVKVFVDFVLSREGQAVIERYYVPAVPK